jgi:hypothetical protein
MRTRLLPLLAGLLVVLGCAGRRNCVPEPITATRHLIDLSADPDAHAPVGPGLLREVEAEFRKRTAGAHPPGARPYTFLAMSGGGFYGAFGVGVLEGWTAAGTRPQFDVVTGISTGAIAATFAFLGPEYDHVLRDEVVGLERRDVLRLRPFPTDAVFNPRPGIRTVEKYLTPQLLGEVAKAHAAGRRLYVGTTNIDTRRLIIWDMGAIATRGTPEAAKLYRDVIVASCSIPAGVPPVSIRVEIDGRRYEELHVDGGVSDSVIFRAFMVADLNRQAGVPGAHAPPGSTLYVVSNGRLYARPECVPRRIFPLVNASSRSVVYGKTRDELYRIYLNCLETGVAFRAAAVPQDLELSTEASLQLTPEDQWRLHAEGVRVGSGQACEAGWRDLPPGTDPSEQALPRTGTRFATPAGGGPPCRDGSGPGSSDSSRLPILGGSYPSPARRLGGLR